MPNDSIQGKQDHRADIILARNGPLRKEPTVHSFCSVVLADLLTLLAGQDWRIAPGPPRQLPHHACPLHNDFLHLTEHNPTPLTILNASLDRPRYFSPFHITTQPSWSMSMGLKAFRLPCQCCVPTQRRPGPFTPMIISLRLLMFHLPCTSPQPFATRAIPKR